MAKKKSSESTSPRGEPGPQVDFESALAEVETVVEMLEGGELGLSESLVQYERGIEKIKLCHQVLQQAEKRIAVLTSVDEDGTASVEPVDTGEGSRTPASRSPASSGRSASGRKPARKTRGPVSDVDENEGLF
ncbi:exodeoxyribonuclease VII small subunit [Stieleria sp. ICT_E10.1]|uniref:exodeoxyribonuclease VII small subunit n=1 Tax=Stieleria sedimenti TaxID=2976331 RepID=UPI00217F81A8|nr:exodeoxyribonuclease VII small subunit [Stieleria sedimenti]MCS7471213.1 exodeoxyribonuclease VII small subunit [Stieleria sedimenti]